MPTVYEGLGTETILHDVAKALLLRLNDEIPVIDEQGIGLDSEWAVLTGVVDNPDDATPIETELVDRSHFHKGSIPSFVQTEDRLDAYPGVAVVVGRTAPDPESSVMDHYDVFQNYISVHAFVKASAEEGADVAVIRAIRTVAAMYRVIRLDTGLRHKLVGTSAPMTVLYSEPWAYQPEDGIGQDWWWCLGGTEYQIKNYATAP